MPANLSPEYMEAEKRLRTLKSDEERLECLRYMLSVIPKHKGTDKMQANLKKRISKIRDKLEQQAKNKKKGPVHKITHEGAGTVALAGPPNVGKSALLSALSGVETRVAQYPFTTLEPQPGMMPYENIQIQLVDFPPVCREHTEAWVYDLIKSCDAFLLVVDLGQGDPLQEFEETLNLLKDHNLLPVWGEMPGQQRPETLRRGLLVGNKMDIPGARDALILFKEMCEKEVPMLTVSAREGSGLEQLQKAVYRLLRIMRIYSKAPGKDPDMDSPFTVPIGSTLLDFAAAVHHDFAEQLKTGRVWGSARFEGMMVKQDHVLEEGDIVELHT